MIKIYTTKNCPFSKKLKDFLYDEGISFEEIKVDENKAQAEELYKIDQTLRTPVIILGKDSNKKVLIGWNETNKAKITVNLKDIV